MTEIKSLQDLVVDFRDQRDWKKYHNPKDLCISISIESAELLELFQWKSADNEVDFAELKDEMADILIYLLSLADVTDVDLGDALKKKIEKNREKYPADKSKGF
ncbi:MAG: nucleotide pyrophosphohydrolase [Thermoplasmata archaeon]